MKRSVSCSEDFKTIAEGIVNGETVVYPTDTVYGLGSNPFSEVGVKKCFQLKSREFGKALPVLCSSTETAEKLVRFNELAQQLAQKFWPGPLTLALPSKTIFPEGVAGEDGTLAVRVPNHECALRLIEACNGVLIGTSANKSGGRTFSDPSDPSLQEFAEQADYFVIGACGKNGISSTIIKIFGDYEYQILRAGAISEAEVSSYLSKERSIARS